MSAKLVYDGECPFCKSYVKYLELKESVGEVVLVDARIDAGAVEYYRQLGFDLNDGFILDFGGAIYHGDAALHMIAILSGDSNIFNKMNRVIFRSKTGSRIIYPILRAGRNFVLAVLKVGKIG